MKMNYFNISLLSNKTSKMHYTYTLLLALLSPIFIFSQTGPGGVGSTDGNSSLEFWYTAEGESYVNNALVGSITDRSGNTRTLTGAGGQRPKFNSITTGANNMPSLLFNGGQGLKSTYKGNSNENMSFGIMFSYTSNSKLNIAVQHGGRNTIAISKDKTYTDFVGKNDHTSTMLATSDWTFHAKTFANTGTNTGTNTNELKFYVNNTNTDNFPYSIENRTSDTWIGRNGTALGGGDGFVGGIAEVYKFSKVLNAAEQIIIANYLAAKYNVTLTTHDIYDKDDAANGNYDFDVAGIGRVDASNLHNDSQGTGIVRILNPSDLGDDEFLIWGHDNGIQQAIETIDVPLTVLARFDRVWRVSEVNRSNTAVDVGAIDIRFDLTGLGTVTPSDLVLLVDTNNDGFFINETPILGAVSLGGGIYQFPGVTAIKNNVRFTLGTINPSQTPLPIELLNFSATPVDNKHVYIDWQTASERNNDFFTIERSKNGKDWEEVDRMNGAGNSSSILSYDLIDYDPFSEVSYYRLKQTDFDGQFEYFQIKSVNFKGSIKKSLDLFPNPFQDQITIKGSSEELANIIIYNVLGKDITKLTKTMVKSENKIVIDLSMLANGVYYIISKNTNNKVYKQ